MLIFSYISRRQLRKQGIKVDKLNQTPSDFALVGTNLPLDKTEKELEGILKQHFS